MLKLKSRLSLDKLLFAASCLEHIHDEGYVQMASAQSSIKLSKIPSVKQAIEELESLRKLSCVYVMINTVPAKQHLPVHQDWLKPTPLQPYKGPLIERWHLPLRTNPGVLWFDKTHPDGEFMPLGFWCGPVPYWNKHSVINGGDQERIHLIVDLDCPEPMGMYEN